MSPDPHLLLFSPIVQYAGVPGGSSAAGTWEGLLLFITVAIGFSFLCSILEAVLLSTSVSFIESNIEAGRAWARRMQAHKAGVERPIAAILTLNTFAHTIGAAGAGAEAQAIFGDELFAIITAILTLMILVFSEIIPKTLGATYWQALNPFAAYAIQVLVWAMLPIVWLLEQVTKLIGGGSTSHAPTISRAEIEAMARIGASEGALLEREDRILRNVLQLNKVQVGDIMTPRTVVLAFQRDMTVREVLAKHTSIPYSRLPIYAEDADDIEGFVLRHEIFLSYANGEYDKLLHTMQRDIIAIPESASVSAALEELISKQEHICLVIDEYGGTAGILTMEDTIETLLGIEITDESDLVADLRKMAEDRYARQRRVLDVVTARPADGSVANGKPPALASETNPPDEVSAALPAGKPESESDREPDPTDPEPAGNPQDSPRSERR